MTVSRTIVLAALLAGFVPAVTPGLAQTSPKSAAAGPTDGQVRELEKQIKSLQQQLDQLNSTKDPASRQRIMQQNWQAMQDYMRGMQNRWGTGYPWMMGPGMMRGPRSGSGAMGCPMFGGNGMGWSLPKDVGPDQYSQQMREHMQRMQEQMNKIAQTADPQERQRLMQEHWEGMYQGMQTMRGMGWMWGGPMMGPGMMHRGAPGAPAPSAKSLPDPDSAGAKLVSTYCIQCHAAPQPTLHTAKEWASVTERMHARMDSGWQGIKTPSEQEMKTILDYLRKNAR